MAQKQSFDVECSVDLQEVDNALNQTRKELSQRYDFKGIAFEINWNRKENVITINASDEYKLKAIWDVMQTKMSARKVPLKNLQPQDMDDATLGTVRQRILIQQGIPGDKCKEIVKFLKGHKLKKLQAQIQGDTVRVVSPSRDTLQEAMTLIRAEDFGLQLSFGNYR